MIWPFSIFGSELPTIRRLPWALFTAACFGVLAGPVFLITAVLVTGKTEYLNWAAVRLNAEMGATMAVAFYATCGLPAKWLSPVLKRYPRAWMWTIRSGAAMAGGALGYAIGSICIEAFLGVKLAGWEHIGRVLTIEAFIALVISLIITALNEKEVRARALAETAARAQAAALQAQINPHFFFNTLNTVSALIPVDARAAQDVIGRMADMFRYTMAASDTEAVTLGEELDFVHDYLAVESARYRDRLRFSVAAANGVSDVRLPGLTLQPLVENAIRHGVAKRLEGGRVQLEIAHNGSWCTITVRNEFEASYGEPDLRPTSVFRAGHALANIRERLRLVCGPEARIEVVRDGEWVASRVQIPAGSSQ